MNYKFTSNDNKGHVNTLRITSTKTEIHNVPTPSEDGDAAPKSYVDQVLPVVTADDVGKVLMVDEEGHWVVASLPSGAVEEPKSVPKEELK